MFRICLLNMPFSNLVLPSIALTQLKSVVESAFGEDVSIEIHYLNHDFAKFLGMDFYVYLANSMESLNTGLGDWMFRPVAFPQEPDNTEKYFKRYFPASNPEAQRLRNQIVQKRPGLNQFMDELISRHKLDEANLVGFTSMFMQNTASFGMARKLKQRNPSVITVLGGANCEFPMSTVIAQRVPDIDFVFSGPALKSFPEFVGHCLAGDMSKTATIRGVFAKEVRPPQSGPQTIGEDLGIDVPVALDYSSFIQRMEEYFPGQVTPVLTLETSRGCWWGERAHCTFCGLNGISMAYRAMKPQLAIDLFNSIFQYSGRVSRIMAVDNILPKNYFAEVLPFLNTPPNMDIFYEVKADLSEQDIQALKLARVNEIQPGIEALATKTLKLMKKGTTVFQNLKLLKLCALFDVRPQWNLLIGFPGEGEEVYRRYTDLIPYLVHLQPPSGAVPVRFDRFSPYFKQAKEYGLDLRALEFYSLIYPFSEADLQDLAYYFMDKNVRAEYFLTMLKWIGKIRTQVAQWRSRWMDHDAPPRLFFKGNSDLIYDSRSRPPIEYRVGQNAKLILEYLIRPTRMDDLLKVFPADQMDVVSEIAKLHTKRLLFEEDERLFSLVLEGDHGSRAAQLKSSSSLTQEADHEVTEMVTG